MGEFDFIAKHLVKLAGSEALDLKDDVAIWPLSLEQQDAVITMDTIVEGVHFPNGKFDAQLAQKLIRVNISDLVAKGASPLGYFLSLTLPSWVKEEALIDFCKGLAKDQNKYGLVLWGGDTTSTRSDCVLTITMIGTNSLGQTVLRSKASAGDYICVTGTIGDGYLGLKSIYNQLDSAEYEGDEWARLYTVPQPPFEARNIIKQYAKSALDISDGLIADATHLARASKVGIDIDLEKIPLSRSTTLWLNSHPDKYYALTALVNGGDDYQVLMTVNARNWVTMRIACEAVGISCTRIGTITDGDGVRCFDKKGVEIPITFPGYTHF
ncbi:MAG: thiamine-phosphate kinase [Robiginitomaculum sp.]